MKHIHYASSARERALAHNRTGQATMFASTTAKWTHDNMMLAVREFKVPTGLPIHIIWPDLFDRDLLIHHQNYRFEYKDKLGNKKVGIKTPCPCCKSNRHVYFNQKSGYKKGGLRMIHGVELPLSVLTGVRTCFSKTCYGPPKEKMDNSDKVSDHTYHLYSKDVWCQYP
jgi:hypothetical protein